MRSRIPRAVAPVLFVAGCGLLALAWAMAEPAAPGSRPGPPLGEVALWLGCVALATALVWRAGPGGPGSTALAGLALALTPSAVELSGGDDGLAIAATLALAAGLLRLGAERPRPRPWIWAATGAAAVVLVAVASPSARVGFDDAGDAVRGSWDALWHGLAAWIGREPGAPGGLPLLGVVVWSLALLALVLAAGRLAGVRARRVLWVAVPLAVAATAFLFAGGLAAGERGWFSWGAPPAPASFAPLALLPLSLLALLAGDLVTRAGAALWPRLAAGCFGLLGAVQVLAFVTLHDAAGDGGDTWTAAALLGAASLAAAGGVGATGSRPVRPPVRPANR